MKVLVTGGCGFVGSHACEYYASRGVEVIAYDNMTKYELERTGYSVAAARSYNLDFLKKLGVTIVQQDIRDIESLKKASQGCDYIIHTAAQPAMTISWEDPALDFSTNVQGTFNVLETARARDIPVVSCGTIHIYGNRINETLKEEKTRYTRQPAAIDETHPTVQGTLSPLHASEAAGDLYVQTYIDTFKLQAASFRLTGLYGPRQFGGEDHGWVANFAIRAITGLPLTIYGTGKQVRDILFAPDAVAAFDAFYRNRQPGIYNIGGSTATAISLLECIDLIGEIIGKKPEVRFEDSRFGDLQYFVCDTARAERGLKWQAQTGPREGVTRLIEWIEANINIFRI
jgi:CDP-paratose 2-epimerase